MLKVSQLMRIYVYRPKRGRKDDPKTLELKDLSVVGQVRQVVFAPKGDSVVGLLVRRPDVAGMVKREDAFVALDSIVATDDGLVVSREEGGMDAEAIERLGLDWNRCILWTGMDAKTTDNKELGWVDDVEFSPKTGRVKAFYVGDGGVAKSLVGNVVIPGNMLVGYKEGYMLVKPEVADLSLNGGLAAKAGEGYARAKQSGKAVASKAGKVADDAVQKGARGLGRAIGKAKKNAGGSPRGMFGAFMDEYRKASK